MGRLKIKCFTSLSICFIVLFAACKREIPTQKIFGEVFGTTYGVVYEGSDIYQSSFDSIFSVINKSMSTYIDDSDISRVNRNEAFGIDKHFSQVLNTSFDIYTKTDGIFDPTIGIVVNAWDFGPSGRIMNLDSVKIDSLMKSVGLNKVSISDGQILKANPNTFLDFNAIAKGYGVDAISEFLENKGVENYIVEIGGEIRCKGINKDKKKSWTVGIDSPNFEGQQEEPFKVISLKDEAMATSGTYRKFKIDERGNRYAHIIDPRTGYPTKTNILSVSVITSNCMKADAYATAFQAMGLEKVSKFLEKHPELKAFFVYEGENGNLKTISINGFPE